MATIPNNILEGFFELKQYSTGKFLEFLSQIILSKGAYTDTAVEILDGLILEIKEKKQNIALLQLDASGKLSKSKVEEAFNSISLMSNMVSRVRFEIYDDKNPNWKYILSMCVEYARNSKKLETTMQHLNKKTLMEKIRSKAAFFG